MNRTEKRLDRLRNDKAQIELEIQEVLSQKILKCRNCGEGTQKKNLTLIETVTYEEECGYPVHTRRWALYTIHCPKCNNYYTTEEPTDKSLFKKVIIK